MQENAVQLPHKKIGVLEIGQQANVENQGKAQPQALLPGLSFDQKADKIIRESRQDKNQQKRGGAVKIEEVAEEKKGGVAQFFLEQQSLSIVDKNYCRKKGEKKKVA